MTVTSEAGWSDADRLAVLEDRAEISELLARYCFLVDSHQSQRLGDEVFSPEGVDEHGLGEWRGTEGLRAGFGDVLGHFEGTAHVLGNLRITLDGDRAKASSYVIAWHWLAGGGAPASEGGAGAGEVGSRMRPADFVVVGAYLDDLEHRPEGWRITRRRFRPVGPAVLGAGELPGFLAAR